MSWRTSAQQAEWLAGGGQHGHGQRVAAPPASSVHSGYGAYAGGQSHGVSSLQGGFNGAGFAVGGDLQSTNERLQKQINDKQTMIDQMRQADTVRSRKMDEERRELIRLRGQSADYSGREARLKAGHAAALENAQFAEKQLATQLHAKDARVESMRQAHADATQQLNIRMLELERLQTGAAHHSAEKETSSRTLRDTQSALMQAKTETARNVGIVQELQSRLSAQFNSDSGRATQDLKSRLFKQSQMLGGFEEENAKLKKAAVQHDGAVLAFKAKIDRGDSVHTDLKQEVDQLTAQLTETRDNLAQTLSSMSEAGSQSEKITAAWTREMEMQAEALKSREGTLTLEKERNKMLEERILELRNADSAEVERLKNVISEKKEEILAVKSQLTANEAQRKADATDAEAQLAANEAHRHADAKDAEALASNLQNDVADADGKVAAVKKMARVQMLTNKRYKEKIDELMQEAEVHVGAIGRLKSKLSENASHQENSRLTRIASWTKLVESSKIINSHRNGSSSVAPVSSIELDAAISKMIILQSQHIDVLLKMQKDYDATKGRIETLEQDVKQAESVSIALQREADESKLHASKIAEDAQSSIDEISKEAHTSILQNESDAKATVQSFETRLEESQSSIRTVSGLFANEAAKSARMEATIGTMEEEWRAVEQNHAETMAKMAEELVISAGNETKALTDLQEVQHHLQNFIASSDSTQGTFEDFHQRDHAQQERIVDLETALAHALQSGSIADDTTSSERFTEQLQLAFGRIQELEGELSHVRLENNAAKAESHKSANAYAATAAEAEHTDAGTKEQLRLATETIQLLEHSLAETRLENSTTNVDHWRHSSANVETDTASATQLKRAVERIQELEISLAHSKQATASLTAISDASGAGNQEQLRVAVARIQELEVSLLQVKHASAQINDRSSAAEVNKSNRLLVQETDLRNAKDRVFKLEAALAKSIAATEAQKRIATEAVLTASETATSATQLEHALSQAQLEKAALADAAAANSQNYSAPIPSSAEYQMTNSERVALQENIKFLKEAHERAQNQIEMLTDNMASAQEDTRTARDEIEKAVAQTADAKADATKVQASLNDSMVRQTEDSECHAATVEAFKMKVSELEAKLVETASTTPDFERMLDELKKANADVRNANERANSADERANTHQKQGAVVQSQLNITSNACIQLSMEHDALKTDFANVDAKYRTCDERLAVAVAARTELENRMLTFAERLESQATSESQSKTQRETEVAKEMAMLLASRDEGLKRIVSITALNQEVAQKVSTLEKEMYNASLNHIAVVTQLEAKSNELSEKTIYQGKTERHCVEEFAAALAEIQVLTDLRKVMETDVVSKTENIEDLEESVDLLTEELDETQKQLLDVTKEAQTLKGQLAESASGTWQEGQLNTQRLHSAQLEVQRLSQKYSELKEFHSDLEVAKEAQAAAHAEECRQLGRKLADEEELRAALNLEKDTAFDDKCAELARIKAEVLDQLDTLESTCTDEKQQLAAKWECDTAETGSAHQTALSNMIYQHEEDIQVLQQINDDALSKHEDDMIDLKQTHKSAIEVLTDDNGALIRKYDCELETLRKTHQTLMQELKDEHTATLDNLYDSNEQAISSLTTAHDTISETLEAELDASEEHVADMSRRALRKQALLEADVVRFSEENGTLIAKLRVKGTEYEDLQELLAKCRDNVSDKDAEITELEQQIAELAGKRLGVQALHLERTDSLEESIRSINMMVLQKTSQLAQMDTRILSLTGEKDNLNIKLTQATIHNLRDEQINHYHDTTEADLSAEIMRLQAHSKSVANERDAVSQQLVVALEQPVIANARHKERVAELQDTICTLTANKTELTSELTSLRRSLDNAKDDLQTETTDAAKQIVIKDNVIAKMTEDFGKAAADHAHWKRESAAKLSLVEAWKTSAEQELADKTELVDRIEARLQSTEDNRNVLLEQLSQSTATTLRMSQMKMHMIDEKEGVALHLAAAKESETIQLALSEQKDEELKHLADEIAELKKELSESQMSNAKSLGTIAELKENALELSGEMERKSAILERVEARYIVLERERDELIGKISTSTAKSIRVAQLQRLVLNGTEEHAIDGIDDTNESVLNFSNISGHNQALSSTGNRGKAETPDSSMSNDSALDASAITSTSPATIPALATATTATTTTATITSNNPFLTLPSLDPSSRVGTNGLAARSTAASLQRNRQPTQDAIFSSSMLDDGDEQITDLDSSSSSLICPQDLSVSAILDDSGLNTSAASPTNSSPQNQPRIRYKAVNEVDLTTDLDASIVTNSSFANSQRRKHADRKLDDSGLDSSATSHSMPNIPRQQSLYESMMNEREQVTDLDASSAHSSSGFNPFQTHKLQPPAFRNSTLPVPTVKSALSMPAIIQNRIDGSYLDNTDAQNPTLSSIPM